VSDFTGYAIEKENRHYLRTAATPFYAAVEGAMKDAPDVYLPEEMGMRTENQGGVGRCAGMASSTAGEDLYHRITGEFIQFNGHYSYIRAQQFDRISGDRGSTIHGNVKAAYEYGFCPEDWKADGTIDYPLPPKYTTKLPKDADQYAQHYKIGYHGWIKTIDQWDAFLYSFQGPIVVGARWGNWRPDRNGVCSRFTGGRGGHAWYVGGWNRKRGLYRMLNSHGTRWGQNGWAWLTRDFVVGMLRDNYTAAVGISNLTTPVPQRPNWKLLFKRGKR
jgi:hypothetical protein